jgi:hypothetical protein
MSDKEIALLDQYLRLPERLEAAIMGLDEADLDLTLGKGWSIRAYIHHVVDGELLWQVNLRAIVGQNGIEFPFKWYFDLTQDEWAERWVYGKRAIRPALNLFRGSTSELVELLGNLPVEVWDHYGRITWPGEDHETRLSVREIVKIHLRHMDQHTVDIQAIRELHGCKEKHVIQ